MNYCKMTNEELDELGADLAGLELKGNKIIPGLITWNPTHKDSNQVEVYLFPILRKKGVRIRIDYRGRGTDFTFMMFEIDVDMIKQLYNDFLSMPLCVFNKDLNRHKLIGCLEVMEELEKSKIV